MLLYPESLLFLHIVRKLPSVHPMNKRQEMMASNSCVYDRNVVESGRSNVASNHKFGKPP